MQCVHSICFCVSSLHQFPFQSTLLHASMPIALQGLELDGMKKRLKEMEDEASALREMQAKVEKEMGSVQGTFFRKLFVLLLF